MLTGKLTSRAGPAHKAPMELLNQELAGVVPKLVLLAGLFALPGCITVNAPEEAIVIELNININAEVVYRLAAAAEETIDANPDIF
jgi:energy-converting hydrogenase Eha subunit E